jgi:hypothetical protein
MESEERQEMHPVTAYAQINARIMPIDRGSRFETPLEEALGKSGLGTVHGGGTLQLKSGELDYCGIDLDLLDLDRGAAFVCEFLERRGAPKGSKLTYEAQGVRREIPFGRVEGLALYLNGTDLPDKVYQECDSNVVIDTLNQLLRCRGNLESLARTDGDSPLLIWKVI